MITALKKIRQLVSGKDSVKGSEIKKILDDESLSKEEILEIQNFLVECNIEVESDYDDEKEISKDIVDDDDVTPLSEEPEEDITENNPVAGYAIEFLNNNNINLDEETRDYFIKEICSVYGDEEEAINDIIEALEEQESLDTIDKRSIHTLIKEVRNENYKRFEIGKNVNDSVKTYLSDIGKIPLYTQEEEREMALKIKSQRELVEKIESKEIDSSSYNLENEQNKLRELEKEFSTHNLRLVVSIARKYYTNKDNFLDLIQEGNIGLQKAVSKYDVDTGYKFSTYATWWIKQAITRSIADSSRTIRIPVHIHEKIIKMRKAERMLTTKLSRTPSNEELAEVLNETPEKIDEIKRYAITPASIDAPITTQEGDQDSSLVDYIPDNSLNPEEETMVGELQREISQLLNHMKSPRAKRVIIYRFGLYENNMSEEEMEATRLRYLIATLPVEKMRSVPESVMEDLIRNMSSRKKDAIDVLEGKNIAYPLKDYAPNEADEERRIMINIINNDPYKDMLKDKEEYATACLVAKKYRDAYGKVVFPSTLLYVKSKFREEYNVAFQTFQQGNAATLEDIGQLEDVTRERIRQIEAKAKRELSVKQRGKIHSLKEYLES